MQHVSPSTYKDNKCFWESRAESRFDMVADMVAAAAAAAAAALGLGNHYIMPGEAKVLMQMAKYANDSNAARVASSSARAAAAEIFVLCCQHGQATGSGSIIATRSSSSSGSSCNYSCRMPPASCLLPPAIFRHQLHLFRWCRFGSATATAHGGSHRNWRQSMRLCLTLIYELVEN